MPATPLRADLVVLVGAFLGIAFLVTALRQWASPAYGRRSLHPLDTFARLLLGASLLLLALFMLAGRTLWADTRVAPVWAAPVGIAILLVLLASALVAGTFALLRSSRQHQHQHQHQHHRRA